MSEIQKLNIKSWSEEDRPREKMMIKGREALSDAELLAILIGSGNKKLTAVGLAQQILNSAQNNLNELGRKELADFMAFNGIGEAKAITIAAALEIGRRRQLTDKIIQPQIISSYDSYKVIAPIIADLNYEEFWIILLNRASKLQKKIKIGTGGVSGVYTDPRIIFKHAIENLSSRIVLAHNHPSGNLRPSKQDRLITHKLIEGAKLLNMVISDHLIISQDGYYSFADEGDM